MTPKIKNLITRTITGVLFVAIMVTCFLRPVGMVFVFALITSLSLWEYTGLVNENKGTSVNRFISTVAGTYFFLAVAGVNSGFIATNAVFVPYQQLGIHHVWANVHRPTSLNDKCAGIQTSR